MGRGRGGGVEEGEGGGEEGRGEGWAGETEWEEVSVSASLESRGLIAGRARSSISGEEHRLELRELLPEEEVEEEEEEEEDDEEEEVGENGSMELVSTLV